uniref:ethanolamine ammonia-lyase light chain EutC n=1 Tax=Thauera sp. SDU_THAU2 TaxID=3136633 RepID=UPI00311EB154
MDQKEIESIVRAVLGQIGGAAAPAPASTSSAAATPAGADGGCLPDLGDASVKNWIGVRNPKSLEVLQELKRNSGSRVCSGRVGTRPRTTSLLRFLADHSRSKDTVLQDVPAAWLEKTGLLEVHSEIKDKDQYLTRPDLGRRLSAEAVQILKSKCKQSPQVQVVVSDGLSYRRDHLQLRRDPAAAAERAGERRAGRRHAVLRALRPRQGRGPDR